MSLPVIDISGLASSNAADRAAVGRALYEACSTKGFFACVGHGIPQGLMDASLEQTRAFFALPIETKLALHKEQSPANRGYEPVGDQTLEPGAAPDQKEGFYLGDDLREDDPRVLAGTFNAGANVWPSDLPSFRPVMVATMAALRTNVEGIMRGLALSLDLDEDHFDAFVRDPMMTLRPLHYPPVGDGEDPGPGAGAHTDFGGITMLLQDDVGGLEVDDPELGRWVEVPPTKGAYVVNLGDMISRWTNDRYRSTRHRVVTNHSGRDRYSLPFFYTGNPDHVVSCIETCLEPGEEPRYPPIRVQDHMKAMYARTYDA
ncbi:MAG: 2-oxoglutarate and iron-dependent oxygenase domain-containing protein [Actinomycetota bacterium]